MAHVERNGVRIAWTSAGTGEPVVLINGLSSPSQAWFRVVPHLVPDYRVITIDNRGVGQSDAPRGRYSVTTMARDVAAVLDAAAVDRAHVIGISMGSCIAQEIAVLAPERVLSLVLASSNPGTRHSQLPARRPASLVFTAGFRDYGKLHRALVPYTYHPKTDRARVEEDLTSARGLVPSKRGLRGQVFGCLGWDRYGDLPKITAPTLVLHGAEDLLDPVVNGERLAEQIPGSQLVVLADASHQVFTDQEEAAVGAVRTFLGGVSRSA